LDARLKVKIILEKKIYWWFMWISVEVVCDNLIFKKLFKIKED